MPVKTAAKDDSAELLHIDDHTVRITHPEKLYFSREVQLTKLDLVRYALAIAPEHSREFATAPSSSSVSSTEPALRAASPNPSIKNAHQSDLPAFLRTVTLSFPSGRTAEEVVVDNPAGLAWIVNLGCIEFHPHPVRAVDLDHPDELRIDLDPGPGVEWPDVRAVALEVKAILEENSLTGWPKTSGSRGMHVNVRIHPRWTFTEVRRAALALARAVERRVPTLASSKWWKEERHGVFLDYNQNAKDRTTASAYSVRPLPDARVSAPLHWHEVPDANPADFTVLTMPKLFAERGNPHEAMDAAAGSLDQLLALAARDEAEGLGDAPWPPHFVKQEGEAKESNPPKQNPSPPKAPKASEPTASKNAPKQRLHHQFRQKTKRQHNYHMPHPRLKRQWAAFAWEARSNRNLRAESPASLREPKDTRKPHKTPTKRTPKHPLIIVAQSTDKSAAEAGLDRWTSRPPRSRPPSRRSTTSSSTACEAQLHLVPHPRQPPSRPRESPT